MRAGIVVTGFGLSLLALGALADKVVEAHEAVAAPRATLRLVWVDVHGMAADIHQPAAEEVTSLLAPAGLDVQWAASGGAERIVEPGETQVVLLDQAPRILDRRVMGTASAFSGGARTVWVFLRPVRAALGLPSGTRPLGPRESHRMGRAVARVILHELVHAAAPERPHARSGLMAARLTRSDLESLDTAVDTNLHPILRTVAVPPESPRVSAPASATILASTDRLPAAVAFEE